MNEDQKKWLLDLQSKGVKLEGLDIQYDCWRAVRKGGFDAYLDYRIPAQSIPDIPDWRELCRDMQDKGAVFEHEVYTNNWQKAKLEFTLFTQEYRIPQQPIPEWSNEEMTKETKPDPIEEIPHREQQIQWHEDWLHHLRTGEPMREYEFRSVNEDGDASSEWKLLSNRHPSWAKTHEYRRKPRTVTYWHCVVEYADSKTGCVISEVLRSAYCKEEAESDIARYKAKYQTAKFSPVIETTVELED